MLIFTAGAAMLASAATPELAHRLVAVNRALPLAAIEASHFAAGVSGALLLFVAYGVNRRRRAAYWAALGLLSAGAVFSLVKGAAYEEAAGLAALAFVFAFTRGAYYRPSTATDAAMPWRWLMFIAAALALAAAVGFYSYQNIPYANELWTEFRLHANAPRFFRAVGGALAVFLIFLAQRLIGPPRSIQTAETPGRDELRAIVAGADSVGADAPLAFLGDKQFLLSPSRRTFVMFARQGTSLVAMGPPIGRAAERRELLWAFRDLADRYGRSPVLFAVEREDLPDLIEAGFTGVKIGERARVLLADFSLEGPANARMRQAVRRGERDGLDFELTPAGSSAAMLDDLRRVSNDWLAKHNNAEKGFSLGAFDEAYLAEFPLALARREGRIVAFANVWTNARRREAWVDMMRFSRDSPNGVMDFLFVKMLLWARGEGLEWFNLGVAPLAGLDANPHAPLLTRVGAFIFSHGEAFYGFEGLRRYKDKFRPKWDPVYIAGLGGLRLSVGLGDAALLTNALRRRHERRPHARRSRPAVLGRPRTHPSDRGEGAAQTETPEQKPKAQELFR